MELIIQYLQDAGYDDTVSILQEESGIRISPPIENENYEKVIIHNMRKAILGKLTTTIFFSI